MAAPTRTPEVRDRHRRYLARQFLLGHKLQREIAAELGISRQQVGYDLRKLRKEWRESAAQDISEAQAAELQRIDRLEEEAWERYLASFEDRELTTRYVIAGAQGQPQMDRVVTKIIPGEPDVRWLQQIHWCMERRARLLGLDQPQGIDVTTGGEKLNALLSDERRLDSLVALHDSIRARVISQSSDRDGGMGSATGAATASPADASG